MRPGLRSAAMLLAVAGACAGHAAAAEAERLRLGEMSLGEIVTIPRPTWQGRPLRIETEEFVGMTLLKSEPLVLSDGVHAPYDGYTVVQDLGGVRDVQDAKAHFRLLYRIDIDKAEQEAGRKLEERAVPMGKVLVVDTGKLGWVPGNIYYYCFVDAAEEWRRRAIFIGPTWRIDFDLAGLRLEKKVTRP